MTDDEIAAELNALGIPRACFRSTLLLPLFEVAWADGEIQRPERDLILKTACVLGLIKNKETMELLERWMENQPSRSHFARARTLLPILAHRESETPNSINPELLVKLVDLSNDIARSAGGLWNLFFTVDADEREALDRIDTILQVPSFVETQKP